MDAVFRLRYVVIALALATTGLCIFPANAANYRTTNFLVQASSSELAKRVGDAAEKYRHDLAVYWLDEPLQRWPAPCPIRVVAGNYAAQGVTTYNPQPVKDFQMEVIGTPERILDSVLPHEVTHTVLATHFGRPLPRWADEGICTTVEHHSERNKHENKLREFLRTRRGIAMNRLFLLTEYPSDVLPMYAQGYSVCQFLIGQKGPHAFIDFLHDYMARPSWTENVRVHYGYESLAQFQEYWLAWVEAGSGPIGQYVFSRDDRGGDVRLASATQQRSTGNVARADGSSVYTRSASPRPIDVASLSRTNTGPTRLNPPSNQTASNNAAANNNSRSWYSRQQNATPPSNSKMVRQPSETRGENGNADLAFTPPSIRNYDRTTPSRYQAAQPQPEQSSSSPTSESSSSPRSDYSRLHNDLQSGPSHYRMLR